ncbi:MFS transporter, MCP family, solute carrier family 16, member 10 [Xylariaceae sp. FL0804]|nr:MFS transporter, MCP family, solute carrier family 16, member 10 [Xylariaceae sp. FL0804]
MASKAPTVASGGQRPSGPPNGGLQAWAQVAGSFFMFLASWGTLNTFGVFQTFYQENFLSSYSPADISWIGTVQGFLLIVVGVLSGPIYDLGHLKLLIFTGAVLVVLGLLTASAAYHYYSIFLSLGVAVGLGSGCLFVPSIAIVSTYFTTKRSLATGITASGGSIGGVVFPIVFRRLLDTVGFGWACRTLGLINAALLVISFLISKPYGPPPTAKRRLIDPSALRNSSFLLFSISLFVVFIGLYVPFFYISDYAMEKTGASSQLSFYLLAIQNAGSAFGRVIPNLIAVRTGSLPILLGSMLGSSILAFCWPATSNIAGVIVVAILYGFFSGAVVSLPPSALVALSPDLSVVGSRLGISFSFAGLGLLIGNPIAGVIVTKPHGFLGQGLFAGATVLVGFALMCAATVTHKRDIKQQQVLNSGS